MLIKNDKARRTGQDFVYEGNTFSVQEMQKEYECNFANNLTTLLQRKKYFPPRDTESVDTADDENDDTQ